MDDFEFQRTVTGSPPYDTNMKHYERLEDLVDNYGGYIRCRYKDGVNYIDYINRAPE